MTDDAIDQWMALMLVLLDRVPSLEIYFYKWIEEEADP